MSNPLQPHGLQHARFLLSSTMSQGLLKFMFIESVVVSNHLILCSPLLLLSVFSQHQCLSHWVCSLRRFLLQHRSFQWISSLISFRIDWFDLLAVQGTLKTPLQHHSLKAAVLWHSDFFVVQLSHPYMTTGKTLAFVFFVCFFVCLFVCF